MMGLQWNLGTYEPTGISILYLGCGFFLGIVLSQPFSDLRRLDSHDRVLARDVGWGAMKQAYPNRALFQLFDTAFEDIFNHIG